MKKSFLLAAILLLVGCTSQQDITLEVTYVNRGCSGMNVTNSEVMVLPDGLSIISNILSVDPCFILDKAELTKVNDNVTVFFTFSKDSASDCGACAGAYLGNQEVSHSFTS